MAFLISLLLLLPVSQSENITQTQTKVEEVTIYRDGAQLVHRASVQLQEGRNRITFSGLASQLNTQSIQLKSDGDITLISVNTVRNPFTNPVISKQADSLNTLMSELKVEKLQLEGTIRNYGRQIEMLTSNLKLTSGNQRLSTSELQETLRFFEEQLTVIEKNRITTQLRLEQVVSEIERLELAIRRLSPRSINLHDAVAVIESPTTSMVNFEITYISGSATWFPSYDVRYTGNDNPLRITYLANIMQNTGLLWEDVQLTLSSAKPQQQNVKPELSPWFLDFIQPEKEADKAMMVRVRGLGAISAADYRTAAEEIRVLWSDDILSFSYKIEPLYTIEPNNSLMTIRFNEETTEANYVHFTAPKSDQSVYLIAEIEDWQSLNFLGGIVNLYIDNKFLGRSIMHRDNIGDVLTLTLGRDESIVVNRKPQREFTSTNFFGNRVRQNFQYEITVQNNGRHQINLQVQDQLPVSSNEDIRVTKKQMSGSVTENEDGFIFWKLELNPNQTETIQFGYQIEYPRGRQIDLR